MRYGKLITVLVMGLFLIATFSITVAFAKNNNKPPSELEQRVTDLEGQVTDHETRIGDAETRLDTLEQNQTQLQTDVPALQSQVNDHEGRIGSLEQQTPAPPGLKASDANGVLLGILMGMDHVIISGVPIQSSHSDLVYIPSLGKFFRFNQNGTNVNQLQQLWWYASGDYTEYDPTQYPYPIDTQWALCCGHVLGVQHFIMTFKFTNSDIRHFAVEYDSTIGGFLLTEVQLPFDYPVRRPISIVTP